MNTNTINAVSSATRAAVDAVIRADPGISPLHRSAILRALDTPPGASPLHLTATDAAERLGVSVLTVTRWIDKGKLDGFRIGQRTTAATVASVQAMQTRLVDNPLPARTAIEPPPPAKRKKQPLPDRLAHLATAIGKGKPRKSPRT